MATTLDYRSPGLPAAPKVRWGMRVTWPVLLVCVYAPYAWIVLEGGSWPVYRILWLKLWPILPGIGAILFVRGPTALEFMAIGALSAALVGPVLLIFSRPRRPVTLYVVAGVVLVLSCLNSWLAYAIYRA
jgi:hypothetical protein